MRHRIVGRQLSRTASHRLAMRRNMAISLFQHGAIRTTEAKAKELKPFVEKLVTLAKKGTLHARRLVSSELGNVRASLKRPPGSGFRGLLLDNDGNVLEQTLLGKIFDEIAPRYRDRPGGYTRIIRLAERRIGDAGRQVVIQLVADTADDLQAGKSESRRHRRAAKRHEAVQASAAEESATPRAAAEEPTAEKPAAADADQGDPDQGESPDKP